LTAAGQPAQARARLDTALQLAEDIGMCFYDAELLRLRAHTHTDPDARHADITAARALARRQGATRPEALPRLRGVPLILRAAAWLPGAARNPLWARGSWTAMGDDEWELNFYGSVVRL
jgi:hypothetical protein